MPKTESKPKLKIKTVASTLEVFESRNIKDTLKIAKMMAAQIKMLPCLILLEGDLGAGKTEWAKGFISAYLAKKTVVTSPTYSIVNAYKNRQRCIYHFDLYRLGGIDDLESVGFWDFLEKKNVCVVEWGNHLPHEWPARLNVIRIEFEIVSESTRLIRVNWLAV